MEHAESARFHEGQGRILQFFQGTSVSANNPLYQTGDNEILYSGTGSQGTGALVIAPYSSTAGGLRMDSSGNMVETGNLTVSGGHLVAAVGTAPTIAAQSGAGTGATATLGTGSSDMSGLVALTTGTGLSGSAPLVFVTFNKAYAVVPKLFLSPAPNGSATTAENTAALTGTAAVWGNPTLTGFYIDTNSALPAASTSYAWNYLCIG